jgi:predicted nucleic acid-binding protein
VAIERLLQMFESRQAIWVVSEALIEELLGNPDEKRKTSSLALLILSSETAPIDEEIGRRAIELETAGYGGYDALHLAIAEHAQVDVLLTTDDRFEKRVRRGLGIPRIRVENPLNW